METVEVLNVIAVPSFESHEVREIAEAKKMNMAKLSRLADINYNTIRAIYNDPHRDVAVTTLEKISKALKVDVAELYEILPDEDSMGE